MAVQQKLLFFIGCLVFLLAFLPADAADECGKKEVVVSQHRTGKTVAGQPQYKVTVTNTCSCSQRVFLEGPAGGISSVEPVDPDCIRSIIGGYLYMVYGGRPLPKDAPVHFTYSWTDPHDFTIYDTIPICS